MATHLPRCMSLTKICYTYPDFEICQAASRVCWDGVIMHYDSESGQAGGNRNRFDITHPCETEDELCYPELKRIETYLNEAWVFDALGVPAAITNYSVANFAVEHAFDLTTDAATSTQPQVLYLLNSGVDVLFYQGNLDLACNTAGNLQWASSFQWKGQPAFVAQSKRTWTDGDEKVGWFKEVKTLTESGRETTFAMSTVDGAGHLVPFDKPREALALMQRWLGKRSFA